MAGDHARAAVEAHREWQAAFNARDIDAMLGRMRFPHYRLAGGAFHVWETPDDFRAGQEALTARLAAEGWERTETLAAEAVHASADKVHLALRVARVRAGGEAYAVFDSLWIYAPDGDGRWRVVFRSSYIADAAHGLGAAPHGGGSGARG